jgi:hypothetical protein
MELEEFPPDLGELFPRVELHRHHAHRDEPAVIHFYNQRGTAEQWIKEGKAATHWTRLSCTCSRTWHEAARPTPPRLSSEGLGCGLP